MTTLAAESEVASEVASDVASSSAQFQPAWLSWVGAVTGCLKALGVECDTADVAGQSGYAFRIHVHRQLCPSGPTNFAWAWLLDCVHRLGRSTLMYFAPVCHSVQHRNDQTRAHCAAALEIARCELAAGRPCVINGAYVPEFAIVTAVEGDSYRVDTFKRCRNEPQPPVRFDQIEAPGGPYVLGFPAAMTPPQSADRDAIADAVRIMSADPLEEDWGVGASAFDVWSRSLENNEAATFGNAYNAQCWAEARRLAERFVARVAERNENVPPLRLAHAALKRSADALADVAELFPFPGKAEDLSDSARRQAAERLRAAKAADADALTLLRDAMKSWKGLERAARDA